MTNAERIVKILLEDAQRIRGEYWIIDGEVSFADGDVGEINHEGYAIDHARRAILDYFSMDSDDEFIDDQVLADRIIEALGDEGIACDTSNWFAAAYAHMKASGADEKALATLKCASDRGADARDIALKYWGWKWCRGNNIGTWTLTADDRRSIVRGLNDILDQEGIEDSVEVEITIGVGATGKRYAMTMAELESGRSVSRDPTWGGMGESTDDMIGYMQPEIERLTTNRRLRPEEEVSNGTFNTVDLCRRGLEKLAEIHYAGWEKFVNENSGYIEALEAIIASHEQGKDFDGDQVEAHEAVDALWEILTAKLQTYCPQGCFFGSHPGSGSTFGCWENMPGEEL